MDIEDDTHFRNYDILLNMSLLSNINNFSLTFILFPLFFILLPLYNFKIFEN